MAMEFLMNEADTIAYRSTYLTDEKIDELINHDDVTSLFLMRNKSITLNDYQLQSMRSLYAGNRQWDVMFWHYASMGNYRQKWQEKVNLGGVLEAEKAVAEAQEKLEKLKQTGAILS